jgi:hypothetical protein
LAQSLGCFVLMWCLRLDVELPVKAKWKKNKLLLSIRKTRKLYLILLNIRKYTKITSNISKNSSNTEIASNIMYQCVCCKQSLDYPYHWDICRLLSFSFL